MKIKSKTIANVAKITITVNILLASNYTFAEYILPNEFANLGGIEAYLPYVKQTDDWNYHIGYDKNDFVVYEGYLWQAKTNLVSGIGPTGTIAEENWTKVNPVLQTGLTVINPEVNYPVDYVAYAIDSQGSTQRYRWNGSEWVILKAIEDSPKFTNASITSPSILQSMQQSIRVSAEWTFKELDNLMSARLLGYSHVPDSGMNAYQFHGMSAFTKSEYYSPELEYNYYARTTLNRLFKDNYNLVILGVDENQNVHYKVLGSAQAYSKATEHKDAIKYKSGKTYQPGDIVINEAGYYFKCSPSLGTDCSNTNLNTRVVDQGQMVPFDPWDSMTDEEQNFYFFNPWRDEWFLLNN